MQSRLDKMGNSVIRRRIFIRVALVLVGCAVGLLLLEFAVRILDVPPRPLALEPNRKLGGNGIIFIGDKGVIKCGGWGGSPRIIPETQMKEYKRPAKTIARTKGHHRDWLDAIKNGARSCADFEYSAHLTEVVLLGNIAVRVGKMIHWDGENMKATNAPEADQYLKPEYHNDWELG